MKPRHVIRTLAFSAVLAAAILPSTAAAKPTDAPPSVKEKSLLDIYRQGGFLMHPILLCSVGTIAVGVFCALQISTGKVRPKAQVDALTQQLRARDAAGAFEFCQRNANPFTRTISAALLKVNFERDLANKTSMEQAAAETLAEEETRLMLWVNYLNVFATIAPMLGLLGTVTGMIASFDQLAAGRSEPQDLAGGIGEAMITTAGGLFVGIPAMFLYFLFRNRLVVAITDVQKAATFLIDLLSGELRLEEAAAPEPEPAESARP